MESRVNQFVPATPYIVEALRQLPVPVRVLCDRTQVGRDEWLALRRFGIGGSEIAKVCGIAPFGGGPLKVWLSKRHQIPDEPAGEAAEWGNRLEAAVRQKAAEVVNAVITPLPLLVCHPERSWELADLDGIVFHDIWGLGGFEAKTSSEYRKEEWGEGPSGHIPIEYEAQVQWYMGVTGLAYFIVAALIGGNKFRWYKIDRDEAAIEKLRRRGEEFWSVNMGQGVEPAPAGSDNPSEFYTGPAEDAAVSLPLELIEVIVEREAAAFAEKDAKIRKDAATAQIQAHLGNRTTGLLPGWKVTWKFSPGKSGLDTEKLEREYPEVFADCVKSGKPYRTFSIKKEKES